MITANKTAKEFLPFLKAVATQARMSTTNVKLQVKRGYSSSGEMGGMVGGKITLAHPVEIGTEEFALTFLHELQHTLDHFSGATGYFTGHELEARANFAESLISKRSLIELANTYNMAKYWFVK